MIDEETARALLRYLARVTPRGHEEADELHALLLRFARIAAPIGARR